MSSGFVESLQEGRLQEAACEYRASANAVFQDLRIRDARKIEILDKNSSEFVAAYSQKAKDLNLEFVQYGRILSRPKYQPSIDDKQSFKAHEAVWNALDGVGNVRQQIQPTDGWSWFGGTLACLLFGAFYITPFRVKKLEGIQRAIGKIAGSHPDNNVRCLRLLGAALIPAALVGLGVYFLTKDKSNSYSMVPMLACEAQ